MLEEIPEETPVGDNETKCEDAVNLLAGPTPPSKCCISKAEAAEPPPGPLARFLNSVFLLYFPSPGFSKMLVSGVLPAINVLIPLFYTGQIGNESALAVASQFAFVGVLLNVLQDTVVNGMFYLVGRDYRDDRKTALHTFKICAAAIFCVGMVFSAAVMLFTETMVLVMGTPASIAAATTRYLYISALGFPFLLVNETVKAHLLITQHILMVVAAFSQVVATLALNVLLFGSQNVGAHWGVEQLGVYKVIESVAALAISSTFFFLVEEISLAVFVTRVPFARGIVSKLHALANVSWANFCESAVRNFFYFVVTLRLVNSLGAEWSAAWNVLNTVVWSVLLLPAFAVANHFKVSVALSCGAAEAGEANNASKAVSTRDASIAKKAVSSGAASDTIDATNTRAATLRKLAASNARVLAAWCVLCAVLAAITWPSMANALSPNNPTVQRLAQSIFLHVGWVFAVFAFGNAANGLFYGLGETRYVLYVCCISNAAVYLPAWVLFETGVLPPTYHGLIVLYAAGIVLTAFLTMCFSFRFYKTSRVEQVNPSQA